MNYKEIESLKYKLTELVRKSCKINIPAYGVNGRVVGVGFRPYWASPIDTKIDKIEFNVMDNQGRVSPFNFYYITGYEVPPPDSNEKTRGFSFDLILFSPNKARGGDVNEKIRVEIIE